MDKLLPIPGHLGYSITENGFVWSDKRNNWLRMYTNTKGYLYVTLCRHGKRYSRGVGRLVLEAFVGPCPKGLRCYHIDGNKINVAVDNLKWWPTTRLPEMAVRVIIRLLEGGRIHQADIADLFQVSPATISRIKIKLKTI